MKTITQNLWNINDEIGSASADNVKNILSEQAEYLGNSTKGKVYGRFDIIKTLPNFAISLKSISMPQIVNDLDYNGNTDMKDANELYRPANYAFEIYNSTYKFRVFNIVINPLYPVSISLDEDILSELKFKLGLYIDKTDSRKVLVNNDNELISVLQIVFNCKKVQFIINRLMKES